MQDMNKTYGELTFTLYDNFGVQKTSFTVKNLIVTTGKNFIAASMIKTTVDNPPAMNRIALGMGTTAPVMADTALENEFTGGANSRAVLTATATDNVTNYTATFGPGNCTGSVTEAGIFNASSGGTMLARTKFPVITKEASDTLTVSWNIVQS